MSDRSLPPRSTSNEASPPGKASGARSGYDGYKAGVVTGSLVSAEQALNSAFTACAGLVHYDHPLSVAIRQAQVFVTEARRIESTVAQDAMVGRLERSPTA